MNKRNTLLFKLFIFSWGILFLVSPDSYIYDSFTHIDSACFFTCGKAWMNGMTPYVDFADSKGPLLWMIYGIGYLISPLNFIGVFLLSILLYTAIFYYVFKTANIFLKDDRMSFVVTILMSLSFFFPWFHHEIRAEDWCQIFIAMTFYYFCYWLYSEEGLIHKKCYTACFVLGLSLAGTLLIKFTITAMLGFVACYALYVIFKQKINILLSFLHFISGFTLMALPFAIYMLYTECFEAFIQEYFLNTMQTVQSSNSIETYIHEWLMLTYKFEMLFLFSICITGALMMTKLIKEFKYFFLIAFIGFYSISIHHFIYYYPSSCLLFPLFFITPIMARTNLSTKQYSIIAILAFCVTVFVNSFKVGFVSKEWFFKQSDDRKRYYDIANLMSGIKNPTLVYYMTNEHAWGIPVHALPGCKYWVYQTGGTLEMIKNQEDAIRNQQTDFVIINNIYAGIDIRDLFTRNSGYQPIYNYSCRNGKYALYTKHKNLPIPSTDFHVSSLDILLKRKIFK